MSVRHRTGWSLIISFVVALAAAPGEAQQGSANAMQCRGSASQIFTCLDRERERALRDVVEKATSFITMASLSCAHNVYAEWEASMGALTGVWMVTDMHVAGGTSSTFANLRQTIELQLLDSRFVIADAALRNGGRYCRKYADAEYRRIIQDFRDPAFQFARDRAKIGIDDVRALPKID